MTSLAVLLTFFAVAGRVLSQFGSGSGVPDYTPVCDPQNYSMLTPSVPLPILPDQFSTALEVTIVESNITLLIVEHYDYPGNRGRLETIYQGTKQTAIFDYKDGEVFLIPDRDRNVSCGVQMISDQSQYLNSSFGVTYVNGSAHIKTVAQLFALTPNDSALYMGVETVRGIQCNRWQTCHVFDNSSYTLDYYFTTSDWDYVFSGENIPIQIELNGVFITDDGTLQMLKHVYPFIAFHSGPDAVPDSAFAVPTGMPCVGRNAGKDLPAASTYFSLQIETQERAETIGTGRVSKPSFWDT